MNKKIFSYAVLASSLLLILGAAACSRGGSGGSGGKVTLDQTTPITLEYVRLFDDSTALDEIIASYQEKHPNIKIVVRKVNLPAGETIYDYQQDIIKQIADGAGPDIFMIHNDWLPYQVNQISPMPSGLMTLEDYQARFPQVVVDDFVTNNQIYAVPYYIDNLMLYYNIDMFTAAKVKKAPRTWQELVEIVPKLTKKDANGNIIQSALPFGVADGIPRFAEILANLIMQYGGEMTSSDRTKATFDLPVPNSNPPVYPGSEALKFYTSFADPQSPLYTYTDAKNPDGTRKLPEDVQAFMEHKAAMFIGYSYQVEYIKKFMTTRLNFETAPLPQLRLENPIVVANYWGETVSKTSKHPNEAWDFIKYVVTKSSNLNKLFSATHHVPATKESVDTYKGRQYYGPVAEQLQLCASWYRQNSSDIEKIFTEMVNNVLHNRMAAEVAVSAAIRDINDLSSYRARTSPVPQR
ncbi:MAG: extracellular solute-binding protein [Patescibacteria group bacterium]|jgi:multiple sugar transport system substrate-binding protein